MCAKLYVATSALVNIVKEVTSSYDSISVNGPDEMINYKSIAQYASIVDYE